jgi:acyl carrier protein
MNARNPASTIRVVLLFSALFCAACGSQPAQKTVERVRQEAATILNKQPAEIDVTKPLVAQGADELDIVEIVLGLEEAFQITIPDSALEPYFRDGDSLLTVQILAEVVSQQQTPK